MLASRSHLYPFRDVVLCNGAEILVYYDYGMHYELDPTDICVTIEICEPIRRRSIPKSVPLFKHRETEGPF